jgi:hypothetical protein
VLFQNIDNNKSSNSPRMIDKFEMKDQDVSAADNL